MAIQRGIQYIPYQRRLSAAADTGNYRQDSQRKFHVDILQVMLHGPVDTDIVIPGTFFTLDALALACYILQCQGFVHHVGRHVIHDFPLENHLTAIDTGQRPHVDQHVGSPDDFFVMLHDHDSVPDVTQAFEYAYKFLSITRMESDTRFIQNIH